MNSNLYPPNKSGLETMYLKWWIDPLNSSHATLWEIRNDSPHNRRIARVEHDGNTFVFTQVADTECLPRAEIAVSSTSVIQFMKESIARRVVARFDKADTII